MGRRNGGGWSVWRWSEDHVSRHHVRAQIRDHFELFDPLSFRAELERILSEQRLPHGSLEAVRVFLAAWKPGKSLD